MQLQDLYAADQAEDWDYQYALEHNRYAQVIARGEPEEVRAMLDAASNPVEHDEILYFIFRGGSLGVVKAAVLRDGVWVKEHMVHPNANPCGTVCTAVRNPDPAVLGFILGYAGYSVERYEREDAISDAARLANVDALQRLLRDERFNPAAKHNLALRAAYFALRGHALGRGPLARVAEVVRLLLRDHRVLDGFLADVDYTTALIREEGGGIALLHEINAAVRDRHTRRLQATTMARGFPKVSGVFSSDINGNIAAFAGLTPDNLGVCKCSACNGDKLP
jgi:hypothetical protein